MHGTLGRVSFALAMLVSSVVTASDQAGFVEGHINVGPLSPVEQAGGPAPNVLAEAYASLKVTIFKADGKTEIAQFTPDSQGKFRQSLAPGRYVLDIGRGRMTKANLPQTITIVSDQTVRVDINIDTGIR
jgi:hypothetical protein